MMGFSALGLPVARRLRDAGFNVAGWARTPLTEPGTECFYGPDQLVALFARTDILVNTLAVTPNTTNIINAANLARLPKGAKIMNLARGEHVVDDISLPRLIPAISIPRPSTSSASSSCRATTLSGNTHGPHTGRRPHPEVLTTAILENLRCCWWQPGAGILMRENFV